MLNVRLADNHLYGKKLFTWLSLVVSLLMSLCAVLFPMRYLGKDLGLNWVGFRGFSYLLSHRLQCIFMFTGKYFMELLFNGLQ